MRKESLSVSMPKLILAVVLIVGLGAVLGMMSYSLTVPKSEVVVDNVIEEEEIEEDIDDEEIIQDETVDWKTYRNEEFGLEVKYPLDFKEQKIESDGILLEAMKTDRGSSYHLSMYVMPNYKIDQIVSKVLEAEEIIIGDYSGYKYFYIEGAGMSEVALIQLGEDALSISFDCIGANSNFATANDRKIFVQYFFNQILSTFKFIEKDETADWKTYRNEEYGFEFKYPKDWGSPFVNNESKILFGCSDSNKECLLTLSFSDEFPDINYRSKARFTIDSRNAEKYIGYGVCKSILRISDYNDDNRLYKILFDYECSSEDKNKILDQIISTFKFTKQIDVDSWNIYNNEKYDFQLRYPEGFSVINLEQTKNNLDPFYQNWIYYIFEREYFGNPIVIFINHKYVHFIVVHINEKDKGSECLEDKFLIGKEGQMMSKETTAREIIGESDFYKEEWREGMDASHFLNYRTVHDNKCFMMTTNLEDSYPSNPVKMELYDKIIHSFKFTK